MDFDFALGLVGVALGLGLLVYAAGALRHHRIVASQRPTRIGELRPGQFVDLWGKVVPMRTMTSPHCAKACVYFHYVREAYQADRRPTARREPHDLRDRSRVEKVNDETQFVDFLVDDGSGKAMVAPLGADFIFEQDHCDPEFVSMSVRLGPLGVDRSPRDGDTRVEETYLEPGDRVHVIGRVRRLENRASPAGDAGATWVIEGAGAPLFIVSDRPRPMLARTLARRWQMAGVGAILALGFAAAMFLVSSRGEARRAAVALATGARDAGGASVVAEPPGLDAAAPVAWLARLESSPPGAKIYRGSGARSLGSTPAVLTFEGDEPVPIELELPDGRKQRKVLSPADRDFSFDFGPGEDAGRWPDSGGRP